MKLKKTAMILLTMCLLFQNALAGSTLSARLAGEKLIIRWNAEGACVLTVYRDNWPITVCNVDGASGGTEIPVQRSGRYSVRLRTADGCEKVDAVICDVSDETTVPPSENPATPAPTEAPVDRAHGQAYARAYGCADAYSDGQAHGRANGNFARKRQSVDDGNGGRGRAPG